MSLFERSKKSNLQTKNSIRNTKSRKSTYYASFIVFIPTFSLSNVRHLHPKMVSIYNSCLFRPTEWMLSTCPSTAPWPTGARCRPTSLESKPSRLRPAGDQPPLHPSVLLQTQEDWADPLQLFCFNDNKVLN